MSHIELCVLFTRKPEIKVIALVRSKDDARMFVEQKLALARSGVEIIPDESPKIKKWLDAEWTVISIPEETQYVLPDER